MVSKNIVFVDTSMFKAIVDENDGFHSQAIKIWENLLKDAKDEVVMATSNFVIDETLTLIRIRCGLNKVKKFREKILASNILKIVRVVAEDEAGAWEWFLNDWSNLSFTDCVSFALMKRLEIKKALTFDQHFARAGFGG